MDAVHSHHDAPSSDSGKEPKSGSDENRPPVSVGSGKMPAPVEDPSKFGTTLFDRNRGPRPPVPGEETSTPYSDGHGNGGSSSSPPPPPPPLDPWKKKQILRSMELARAAAEETPSANERPADFAPEGSAAESARTSRSASPSNRSDCSSSTSSSSSSIRGRPPCFSWANSLKNLLGDSEGVELFQGYLQQEQCPSQPLQFWFACRGFNMQAEQGQTDEDEERLCKLIYRKFLRNNQVAVSDQTRRAILQKLGLEQPPPDSDKNPGALSGSSSWSTLLGRAQQEVEDSLSRSTYANFLESDLYLQAVTEQIERRRVKKTEREERKKKKLLRKAGKLEGASGGVGQLPHSSQPTSVQPTGALQPPLPSLPEEDSEVKDVKGAAPTTTLPLTRNALLATVTDRLTGYSLRSESRQVIARPMSPHDARSTASSLSGVSSSCAGLHPYHAMYKSYVPVSRQDSELQSLSSDALTDDTMSTLTDDCASSVDGFGGRGPGCQNSCCKAPLKHGGLAAHQMRLGGFGGSGGYEKKDVRGGGGIHMHAGSQSKWQRRIQRQIRLNAEQNKESVRVTETYFIPRTERPISKEEALAEKNPVQFAKVLTAKLEALKRELESKPEGETLLDERWKASPLSLLPPQLLTEAMQEKFKAEIVDNLDDQAILDNHVNRVWNDSGQQTPRTPPVPAKRPGAVAPGLPPFPAGLRSSSRATGPVAGQPYVYASGKPPAYPSMNPPGEHYHHHRSHHRKRDKETISSISSDSGNVFDSRSSLDGVGLPGASANPSGYGFPKSKSIPDWLADTHHASGRTHGPVAMLRAGGERGGSGGGATTDSGVSATSADSAANATTHQPISPKERVLTWMLRNEKYDTGEPSGAGAVGGSERGSSHRQSRASSSAGGQHQHQVPSGPGSSSRSSHRRHVSNSGGVGPSGASARSMSVERNSRLSWKQQYQQQLQEQQAAAAAGAAGTSSMDDSGVHLMRSAAAKLLSSSAFSSKTRGFHVSNSKNEVIVSGGVGVDDDSGTSTVIGWVYCDEPVPYRSRLPGTQVTLKQFKQLLPRKGHYRYFFKKEDIEFGSGVVQEEISDDLSLLPLWEGKVFATVKPM